MVADSKLDYWQAVYPVVLGVGYVCMQLIFHYPVCTLGLAICFRMVGQGEFYVKFVLFAQPLLQYGSHLPPSVIDRSQ